MIYRPQGEKTWLLYDNNRGADQPSHLYSLISTFVFHILKSILTSHATHKISIFYQAPRLFEKIMLNSTAHKFQLLIKTIILTNEEVYCFKSLRYCIYLLTNVKMPTIGILTFMSRINLVLSWVEHEKSCITLRPDLCSWAAWFESHFVGNPKDMCSGVKAGIGLLG